MEKTWACEAGMYHQPTAAGRQPTEEEKGPSSPSFAAKQPILRDTVIKIDLAAIRHNMASIRALVGDDTAIMPVIKANAYGHGMTAIAPVLMQAGSRYLAVATLSEACQLRASYPTCPIFILGHTPPAYADYVVRGHFVQTVIDYRQALSLSEAACRLKTPVTVHLKAETGLYRLGMTDSEEMIRICELPGLHVEGIFSHLALAAEEDDERQLARLLAFAEILEKRGHKMTYVHIADSVATVDKPSFRLNMIRPGSICYGLHSWESDAVLDVRQALRFETKVSQIHRVEPGQGVSYGYHWRVPRTRSALIATLPFGYCDGYPRRLYEKGYVTIKGVKCPFAGLIGMDQCMVDASQVPDLAQGDPVVIYGLGQGDGMSLQEAADLCRTFKNDIVGRLMARPPRLYTDEDR